MRVLKTSELYSFTRWDLLDVNCISMKLLGERERVCIYVSVSEVPGMSVPLNFFQLSNFPEISFQSLSQPREKGKGRVWLRVLGMMAKRASKQSVGPVSGHGRKDAGVPGSRCQCGCLGYT